MLPINVMSVSAVFYPRSPCGERLLPINVMSVSAVFSIHALLAESDLPTTEPPRVIRFLSTLSLRRATLQGLPFFAAGRFFYPRSPCGERLLIR